MKTIRVKLMSDLFVVAYGKMDPTNDEWMEYMQLVEHRGLARAKQLIYTAGGSPNSAQRKILNDILGGQAVKVAVLSNVAAVHGVVTAMTWYNQEIRAFVANDVHGALDHLGIEGSRHPAIKVELALLRRGLV
jgi:hypothetical protein